MRWRATLAGCHDDRVRFNRVNEEYNLTHSYVASISFTVNRYQAHTHTESGVQNKCEQLVVTCQVWLELTWIVLCGVYTRTG